MVILVSQDGGLIVICNRQQYDSQDIRGDCAGLRIAIRPAVIISKMPVEDAIVGGVEKIT